MTDRIEDFPTEEESLWNRVDELIEANRQAQKREGPLKKKLHEAVEADSVNDIEKFEEDLYGLYDEMLGRAHEIEEINGRLETILKLKCAKKGVN